MKISQSRDNQPTSETNLFLPLTQVSRDSVLINRKKIAQQFIKFKHLFSLSRERILMDGKVLRLLACHNDWFTSLVAFLQNCLSFFHLPMALFIACSALKCCANSKSQSRLKQRTNCEMRARKLSFSLNNEQMSTFSIELRKIMKAFYQNSLISSTSNGKGCIA